MTDEIEQNSSILHNEILNFFSKNFKISSWEFRPKDTNIKGVTRRHGFITYPILGLEISTIDRKKRSKRLEPIYERINEYMSRYSLTLHYVEVAASGFDFSCFLRTETKFQYNGGMSHELIMYNANLFGDARKALNYLVLAKLAS